MRTKSGGKPTLIITGCTTAGRLPGERPRATRNPPTPPKLPRKARQSRWQTAPGISMPSRTNRLMAPYKPIPPTRAGCFRQCPVRLLPGRQRLFAGDAKGMAGLRPKLIQHPASATGAEAQLLQEAFTSQCTSATPFCQETTVAHSLIIVLP